MGRGERLDTVVQASQWVQRLANQSTTGPSARPAYYANDAYDSGIDLLSNMISTEEIEAMGDC